MTGFGNLDLSAALEAAITAQFALFAVAAMLMAREGARALYFLAAVAGLIALMLAGNLGAAFAPGVRWVNTANVFMELLVGPALFLYVRSAQPDTRPLTWKDCVHVLPAFAGMGVLSFAIGWLDVYIVMVVLAYLSAGGWLLWRGRTVYPTPFLRFSGVLLAIFVLALAFRLVIAADPAVTAGFRNTAGYPILLGTILVAAWYVLFTALRWPDAMRAVTSPAKYARSGASPLELRTIERRLKEIIENDRPYLEPDFTLDDLARRLGATPRHTSQLINSEYGMNFSAYMNQLRVRLAARKLSEVGAEAPIKVIMYDSGFRSKSVFNREFRRVWGVTPSEYRRKATARSPAEWDVGAVGWRQDRTE